MPATLRLVEPRRIATLLAVLVTLGAASTGAAQARASAPISPQVQNSRLGIVLDPTDPERVTSLTWIDSNGNSSGNLVAEGGPFMCTDPREFFGQSYGAPEGNLPNLVVAGHLATLSEKSAKKATIKGGAVDCLNVAQTRVTTSYQLFSGSRASEVRITRTLGFGKHTPLFSGVGVRPYVPRVPVGDFSITLVPNGASNGVTYVSLGSCSSDCLTPVGAGWNGSWFADIDPPSGDAMIVLRDPAMTSPVDMTINEDDLSSSNLSSFVLLQPDGGWHAAVQEVEYLCFEDLSSWPQAKRDAAKLPAGCGP